jgi:quinohemoprotein ethanol dehydrogenase
MVAAATAALAAAPLVAQEGARIDDAVLARPAPGQWPTYGRDLAETRYTPLNQINTANVGRLGLAWTWDLPGTGGGLQATPLLWDGVMYFSGPRNVVYALDARTRELRWKWDPAHPRPGSPDGGPRVGPNRGVALYDGKLYIGLSDGRLVALDADTGHPVWSVQTTPYGVREYSITGAPRVVGGKVIIGNGGAEYHGVRGYVTAYDAETGDQAWRFYTVPGDPALGFEHPELEMAAATWSGEWWKLGGGGTAWDSFSYDADANLLYIGTGNPSPWSHYWRSEGEGDNLFQNSILAINPDDGRLVWYYQAIPAENWDYTTTMNMVLADVVIGGRERQVLMTANKAGIFYTLDRITGELLGADPFADVNWTLGYDMETGRPIINPIAMVDTVGAWVSPGGLAWGGHNWHPMSFHPNTGLAYFTGQNTANFYRLDPAFEPNLTGGYSTGMITTPREDSPPPPEFELSGFLTAWDPATRSERWQIPMETQRNGGTLSTGENLLFNLRRDGWIHARNAATGELLWEHRIGNDPVTPITYEIDGVQYVSVLTPTPGTGGRIWTFVLDGNAPSPLQ